VWHHAALNGSSEALEKIICFTFEAELSPDEMLLALGENGGTAFHKAVKRNHVGILQKQWVWTEITQQIPHEFTTKMFLSKTMKGSQCGSMKHEMAS